jgi:hypothetical protein
MHIKEKTTIAAALFGSIMILSAIQTPTCAAEDSLTKQLISVRIDARVELVSLIFRLAGNSEYNRCAIKSYRKEADDFFEDFAEYSVIELAQKLHNQYGVSYDAPMSMAAYLTDGEKPAERVPFDPRPEGLDSRWRIDDAREFVKQARLFSEKSKYQDFFIDHRRLYEATTGRLQKLINDNMHPEWYDEFFGARSNVSFMVVVGMFNGGNCYGPHCRLPDGKEEYYCILGVWKTDDQGLPVFDKDVTDTVVHEFCHSYANPIINGRLIEFQQAGKKIHPRVAQILRRQNYGDWRTMMCESLVRASTLRYIHRYKSEAAYLTAVEEEKKRGFLWIDQLSNLLGEYETNRKHYPNLEAFAPKIVAFFNRYAEKLDTAEK